MVVDGWTIFAHPLLIDQRERAVAAVEAAKAADPQGYRNFAQAKILAMIRTLTFETIPADPTRNAYRQGDTLGSTRKHWFRAKFGIGRFRLFFRFDSRARIIIFAWVNDDHIVRTYGSRTDAYHLFKGMLDRGNPPDAWKALLAAASTELATERLRNP